MKQRLHLSKKNKVIFGVCGGIGESLGVDPVLIRVCFVVLLIVFRWWILGAYLLCWAAFPKEKG